MSFIKYASGPVLESNISIESLEDPDINTRFKKFAEDLKAIAPKAKDFLYFSAIMMHAAEAAILDEDGNIKLGRDNKPLECGWNKKGESISWWCSDSNIKPYQNSNRDIFPEAELIEAHKKWVGKPLCLDHKSSSVDAIRGVVVDTYYDPKHKRIIALCALDKVNYPELAHKVATGYATSVSMGTAVGKAICSDCGNIAKVESDFCDCMRSKRCYGEINTELSPIELSIVVNGADGKAKIRTIVASAHNAINEYTALKEKISQGSADMDLEEIRSTLRSIAEKLENLESEAEKTQKEEGLEAKDINDAAYGMTDSHANMTESEISSQLPNIQTPGTARFAEGLEQSINNIRVKLGEIEKDLQTLNIAQSTETSISKETNMSDNKKEAYFQGGGGVNEPTPGKPKYEKQNYQSIRDNEDKQMVGQMDTGPVDGMHPGPDSVGMSELERKKMLARAQAEERAQRRKEALKQVQANLEKDAYFQGGGDGNEPTPGKPKYNKEDYKKNRDKEDKQMTGQAPFPGVGSIDGLHPSPASADQKDELARKKMLQRASLKAKFVKAANPDGSENPNGSRWDVYAGDKLILTATVSDISGGRVDALYDSIATKQFGVKLLDKIKSEGVDKVAGMFKAAQAPAPTEAAPGAPPEAPGGAAPMPEMPEAEPADMAGGAPADTAENIAEEIRDRASDLIEMLRASEGEAADMADVEELAPEEGMAPTTASLQSMRKKLNAALIKGIKQALAELKDHHEELRLVAHIYSEPGKVTEDNKSFVEGLAGDAFNDAKTTLADTKQLMEAFVKYAKGTEALEKRANDEGQEFDVDLADVGLDELDADDIGFAKDKKKKDKEEDEEEEDKEEDKEEDDNDADDFGLAVGSEDMDYMLGPEAKQVIEDAVKEEISMADDGAANLETKEARAMQRAKIAQKGLKFMDLLNEAHPGGGVTTKLDTKPTGDLAKVETLEEAHNKHMDVANAPPKVRKAAEEIQQLIVSGELERADVDKLIALGVDKEAVKYWHELYDKAPDGGKEFASELTKEKYAAEVEEEKNKYRVKLARAYELATDMQTRSMIDNTKSAFNQMVDEIMSWNDQSFDSIKKVVASQKFEKQASVKIPEVGWMGSGEVNTAQAEPEGGLRAQLEAAMSGRRY